MQNFTSIFNTVVSIGAIVGQIFLVYVAVLWLLQYLYKEAPNGKWAEETLTAIGARGLVLGLAVALVSVLISLVYSDVIGYEPCKLCWIQRIFLYPQAIILSLALWKKTKSSAIYCLVLSAIGALVAGYHFYGQSFNPGALPSCGAIGAASCAVKYFVEFGYVTIPMMSLTAFLLIFVIMLLARSAGRD